MQFQKHSLSVVVYLLILSTLVHEVDAFETTLFASLYPGTLKGPALKVHIEHRFYTSINDEPLENAFGFNGGVVADIGVGWIIWKQLESKLTYEFFDRTVTIGIRYSHSLIDAMLRISAGFDFYNYGFDTRQSATFSHIGVSTGPFLERIEPLINIGYDSEDNDLGMALGVNINVFEFLDVSSEYFPRFKRELKGKNNVNAFAFGVILKTFGHRFLLFLSNSNRIGLQNNMEGAEHNNLHFGFRIDRLFDFTG